MFFHEPVFWVDAAFVLLCVFVFVKAKPRVKAALDERINAISKELDDARDLREQASRELAEVLFRDKNAEREVEQILLQAKEEVREMSREARLERAESVKRVRRFAEERLAEVEARWQTRARASFVATVLGASEKALQRSLTEPKVQALLFERALHKLPRNVFGKKGERSEGERGAQTKKNSAKNSVKTRQAGSLR